MEMLPQLGQALCLVPFLNVNKGKGYDLATLTLSLFICKVGI